MSGGRPDLAGKEHVVHDGDDVLAHS
jgi:hypothetical protein